MTNVAGSTAVVTGGTRGIGNAIARALLERGARVLICARAKDEVEDTEAALRRDFGESIFGHRCDVGSYESVRTLFGKAKEVLGKLDILINNAGIGSRSNVADLPPQEWNTTIDTNLSGVFYCCHEAIPLMKP